MSDSNLHTSAIVTGGESFDTATCTGGKCEYPLIESGNSAKVYYHNMVCTQSEYERLPLNSTLEVFDVTTKPNGGKPERSPFDDDPNAFYVGDFSISPLGNGLVGFQRVFATVPDDHIEPYGLFSRTLPAYTTSSVEVSSSELNTLVIKEQYSIDGATWVDRTTANLGDNVVMGSTIDGDPNVTINDATLDWTNYNYVRLRYEANYEGVATIPVGATLFLKGSFATASSSVSTNTFNGGDNISAQISIKHSTYNGSADEFYDTATHLGDLIVESFTLGTDNSITANTPPFNLNQYSSQSSQKDFGGIKIGRLLRQTNYFRDSFGRLNISSYLNQQSPIDSTGSKLSISPFTREEGEEENCPAHISYTYVRTDQPEAILLTPKDTFPDELNNTTNPTTSQYLASKVAGEYFNAENQFIERYMGNIYRLGQIRSTVI